MNEFRAVMNGARPAVALASKRGGAGRPAGADGASLAGIRIRREEARKCNQRREDRHLDAVDRAELRFGRATRDVAVLNVSSRGAMIACDLQPAIGARIDLRFADCNRTSCLVRWVRSGRIGLEFARETLIIGASGAGERIVGGRREGERPTLAVKSERAPRHGLILRGELHWAEGSMPVRLRNISIEGAMLEGVRDLPPACQIVLEMPGGIAAAGEVRWCRSRQIGLRFEGPFDLEALARPAEDEPARADYVKPDYLKSDGAADSPWSARWDRLDPDSL